MPAFAFETGTLAGWTATGTAFSHQPTYGINTMHRSVYSRVVGTGAPVPGPTGEGGFIGEDIISSFAGDFARLKASLKMQTAVSN